MKTFEVVLKLNMVDARNAPRAAEAGQIIAIVIGNLGPLFRGLKGGKSYYSAEMARIEVREVV